VPEVNDGIELGTELPPLTGLAAVGVLATKEGRAVRVLPNAGARLVAGRVLFGPRTTYRIDAFGGAVGALGEDRYVRLLQ
jgi:hypothetical protein